MNTSQSWTMKPNCRRKQNTNNKKMIVRKLIKKSKMQHYHEALNNSRKNPKDTCMEPSKATFTWKIEAKQM